MTKKTVPFVLLSDWLIKLGVEPTVAVEDACAIEHCMSKESFDAIKKVRQ